HSTQGIPAAACGPELEHVKGIYRRIIPPVLDREIYRRNFELLTDVLDGAGIEWWWVDSVGHRGRRAIGVAEEDRDTVRGALVAAARGTATGGAWRITDALARSRSEEHTSELQSRFDLVCRLLLEKKKNK